MNKLDPGEKRKSRPDRSKWSEERQQKHREYQRAYSKEYRRLHPEMFRKKPDLTAIDRMALYRKRHPELVKTRAREHKNAKLLKLATRPKPDACEVCGTKGMVLFDHCHATGLFRGWLCHGCNCALGFARDNPAILRLLAAYLERHNGFVCTEAPPS